MLSLMMGTTLIIVKTAKLFNMLSLMVRPLMSKHVHDENVEYLKTKKLTSNAREKCSTIPSIWMGIRGESPVSGSLP